MKKIRLFMAACALMLGVAGMVPAFASADTAKQTVCNTLEAGPDCTTTPHDTVSINQVIKALINILSFVIGVVAIVMIMVAGFKYVTASGDNGKVASAKNTLLYAVIGLVIAALAQVIVKFVLQKLQ